MHAHKLSHTHTNRRFRVIDEGSFHHRILYHLYSRLGEQLTQLEMRKASQNSADHESAHASSARVLANCFEINNQNCKHVL